MREAPGCLVVDKREDGGHDAGRMRRRLRDLCFADSRGHHHENGINLWIVSTICARAALNTVQIAETIINRGLMKKAGIECSNRSAVDQDRRALISLSDKTGLVEFARVSSSAASPCCRPAARRGPSPRPGSRSAMSKR